MADLYHVVMLCVPCVKVDERDVGILVEVMSFMLGERWVLRVSMSGNQTWQDFDCRDLTCQILRNADGTSPNLIASGVHLCRMKFRGCFIEWILKDSHGSILLQTSTQLVNGGSTFIQKDGN